jgi:hypothetical protein
MAASVRVTKQHPGETVSSAGRNWDAKSVTLHVLLALHHSRDIAKEGSEMKNATRPRYEEEMVEGRKHRRFKVQDGVFAELCPEFAVMGRIMDISRGGFSFRYVASKARTNGSAKMNILTTDGSFRLEKVPVKTIRDCAMPGEFSFHDITLRNCAVEFAGLTLSQAARVEDLIRSNTLFGRIEAIRTAQQEATESYTSQIASIFRMPSCQAYM